MVRHAVGVEEVGPVGNEKALLMLPTLLLGQVKVDATGWVDRRKRSWDRSRRKEEETTDGTRKKDVK